MKKHLYLAVIFLFAFACKSFHINQYDVVGKYISTVPGFGKGVKERYILELNENSTFSFEQKFHDANPKYTGTWRIKTDTLILTCNPSNKLDELLSNGYMNNRKYDLKIVSRYKLKLGNINLRATTLV